MASPEVVAGIVTALGGLLVIAITVIANSRTIKKQLRDTAALARKDRHLEALLNALSRFGGGSQNRTVGVAALYGLRKSGDTWDEYRDTVSELLIGQLVYILSHGASRWEAHEVHNIRSMIDPLMDIVSTSKPKEEVFEELGSAMVRYQMEWARHTQKDIPGGRADDASVERLIKFNACWIKRNVPESIANPGKASVISPP